MSFWYDVDTEFRTKLFDFSHIMFILSVILIVFLFVYKFENIKKNWQVIRKVMIGVSIVQILALYSWSFIELGFDLKAGLPIHLCRLSTFLGLYFLITENKKVFHALYYMSAFAIIAIMMPVNVHPIYTHIIGWSYQVSHIMIILVWIVGVFMYGYRPSYKVLNKAIVIFAVIELLVLWFNYAVGGGEYLYLLGDVNRPFLKSMNDYLWIVVTLVLSYILMFGMTYIFNRKK